jgi:hypothetical protein
MATYFILYIYALWRTTFILEVIDIANPLARSQPLIFFISAKNDRDLIVLAVIEVRKIFKEQNESCPLNKLNYLV